MFAIVRTAMLLAGAAVLFVGTGAVAATQPKLSGATRVEISVPKSVVTVKPGASYEAKAQVLNYDAVKTPLAIFSAVVLDTKTGGMGFSPSGKWMALSTHHLLAPAHSATALTFAVHVPAGTKPGVYVLALAAQYSPGTTVLHKGKFQFDINLNIKSVALLAIHVPGGPITQRLVAQGLKQSVVDPVAYGLTTAIGNPGNSYEYVQSHLVLRNGSHKDVFTGPTVLLLAHSRANLTFQVPMADVGKTTFAYVVLKTVKQSVHLSGRMRVLATAPTAKAKKHAGQR